MRQESGDAESYQRALPLAFPLSLGRGSLFPLSLGRGAGRGSLFFLSLGRGQGRGSSN
jgi:hypothetical protein